MSKKKRIEFTIDDTTGINAIALVKFPAIEENFQYFSNPRFNFTASQINVEQRTITGPALIPDKDIVRYDEQTNEEFYVWFSKETVRKAGEKLMMELKQNSLNLEHNPDAEVDDLYLTEVWYVDDPENDKANTLGYEVNPGTLMVSYKINNVRILDMVKSGTVKGFSIEGAFLTNYSQFSTSEPKKSIEIIQAEWLIKQLASIVE